jgi:hypothetical protein
VHDYGATIKLSLTWKLIIGCVLTLLVTMSLTFYFINLRQERLILRQAENEARTIFRQIIITRKWVADHGGVFVERAPLPRTIPTPFMADAEIVDEQGRRFTRESPAMVTKALADYAKEEESYWFHITSLNPINPANFPDELERTALVAFEQEGLTEFIATETINRDIISATSRPSIPNRSASTATRAIRKRMSGEPSASLCR